MEMPFKGRRTSVPERFRRHASAKLAKLEKLDHNAIRVDVEVSTERNPRQAAPIPKLTSTRCTARLSASSKTGSAIA